MRSFFDCITFNIKPEDNDVWRSRRRQVLRGLFPAGKFSCFDTVVALAGDVDGEGGVSKPIANSGGNDGIGDHLRPMLRRQLRGKGDGFFVPLDGQVRDSPAG